MDFELLKRAKRYIDDMANGINPITGEHVGEFDSLNNIKVSRCLFYVSNILESEIEGKNNIKIDFYLSKDDLSKYTFMDYDMTISQIVNNINSLRPVNNMKKLKAVDVCNWLVSIGLLTLIEKDGKKSKVPTDIGRKMGMYLEHRNGFQGKYDVVIYKRGMQEFIIDNFEYLLEFIKTR